MPNPCYPIFPAAVPPQGAPAASHAWRHAAPHRSSHSVGHGHAHAHAHHAPAHAHATPHAAPGPAAPPVVYDCPRAPGPLPAGPGAGFNGAPGGPFGGLPVGPAGGGPSGVFAGGPGGGPGVPGIGGTSGGFLSRGAQAIGGLGQAAFLAGGLGVAAAGGVAMFSGPGTPFVDQGAALETPAANSSMTARSMVLPTPLEMAAAASVPAPAPGTTPGGDTAVPATPGGTIDMSQPSQAVREAIEAVPEPGSLRLLLTALVLSAAARLGPAFRRAGASSLRGPWPSLR